VKTSGKLEVTQASTTPDETLTPHPSRFLFFSRVTRAGGRGNAPTERAQQDEADNGSRMRWPEFREHLPNFAPATEKRMVSAESR
jgi:hypothetical protein